MFKPFRRFFQIVYNIYATFIFFIFLSVLFPIVLLTYFLPSKKRGNAIYNIARVFLDIALLLLGIFHKNIFEVPHDTKKPMIFVFNHISYLDSLILVATIRKQNIRGLGKYEIGKIPIIGFIYRSAVITVKRSDKTNRQKSVALLKEAVNNNISIAIAPEGTFNETSKPLLDFFDGAFRIAIETNTPIKPLLFLDTYDRMHYGSLFSLTPGKSRSVFLEEVSVEGYDLSNLQELKQKVFQKMELALVHYKASWIKN